MDAHESEEDLEKFVRKMGAATPGEALRLQEQHCQVWPNRKAEREATEEAFGESWDRSWWELTRGRAAFSYDSGE